MLVLTATLFSHSNPAHISRNSYAAMGFNDGHRIQSRDSNYLVGAKGGLNVVHDVDFDVVEHDAVSVRLRSGNVVHNVAENNRILGRRHLNAHWLTLQQQLTLTKVRNGWLA